MRRSAALRWARLALLVVAVVCTIGSWQQIAPAAAEEDPVEKGPAEKNPPEKNPLAGCQQCHVDIEDEYAPSLHFKEKISCKDCHGPSKGHLADENNEIKPDELFARKDVDRLCGKCHECSRETADESPKQRSKVCIDCHGPHDLADVPLAASQ